MTLRDRFWKPRITTNATVTIPLLVQRQIESGSGRGFNGNVLEAAILSLEVHRDARLQAIVDKRVDELRAQPRGGNGGFEVAAAYYHATGKRDLIDNAVKAADALYTEFKTKNPPFSGGERDADQLPAAVPRDARPGSISISPSTTSTSAACENSVNRSRHNQSYKPVLRADAKPSVTP